jgi:hypothetical protein
MTALLGELNGIARLKSVTGLVGHLRWQLWRRAMTIWLAGADGY